MPIAPPGPVPQLDGPPPQPPGTEAMPPANTFAGLGSEDPYANSGVQGMQTITLMLQTAQAVSQGLDILGKMNPALQGLSAQMQLMLRDGVRSALQQGPTGSEPASSAGPTFQGMGGAV